MRDYSVITPAFWIGETGKKLRGDMPAQVLAIYLMTSPHSTMTGVFHCPILYMAHETGLGIEGATKALARLCEEGFCEYEDASETVFVYRMASFQIGASLKPGDNRIKGVEKDIEKMVSPSQKAKFLELYSEAYSLSPLEAPTKPRTRTGTGTRTSNKHPSAAKLPTCPVEKIIESYQAILPELPGVRVIDKDREKLLKERWEWVLTSTKPDGTRRAENEEQATEWFKSYFEMTRESDFLMGRTPRTNGHQNWQCDIDYLMTTKGLKQVIEKTKVAA